MCGIYGCIGRNYHDIESTFSKELHHRGPDDCGFYADSEAKVSLGHTRLSIIDLSSHAHQPMSSKNYRYTIVFNGEVYNYLEIRNELEKKGYIFYTKSDTEVVLNSFIEWKEKCLERFRGMFAFAIYDKTDSSIFLARDRFGIKPLIYSFIDDQFVFSSELKPLIRSGIVEKKIDADALNDYFCFGSVTQPRTILKNVYQLMPGHYMKIGLDLNCQIEKYYDIVSESKKIKSFNSYDEAVAEVRKVLEEVTQYHLVSDVDVGAFLSGGVDSTTVVALMNHYVDKPIKTFSVGFDTQKEVEDELSIASRTAEFLNTDHHEIIVDDKYIDNIFDDFISSIDQPSIDGINTYIVSKEAGKNLKVALSGLGGDEIFAGYPHFSKICKYSDSDVDIISKIGAWINKIMPSRLTTDFELVGLSPELSVFQKRCINKEFSLLKNVDERTDLSIIQRISKVEIDYYLLNTLLRDSDVTSMTHSLEIRPVLLDHKLVELVFSLKDNYKIRNNNLKSVFIDAVKNILPEETWKRKKTGFEMPFSKWMNGILNNRFKKILENDGLGEIMGEESLLKLKKRCYSHSLRRSDWMYLILFTWILKYNISIEQNQ